MKVWNLQCAQGHGFEGWFASEEAYQDQVERKLLSCPLCGDASIMKLPAAPRLNLGAREELPQPRPDSIEERVVALWEQAVEHVMSQTEDVGSGFAEEARRIHYGEAPVRGIRGQASAEERQALREEDIEVYTLPVPASSKGTLQ